MCFLSAADSANPKQHCSTFTLCFWSPTPVSDVSERCEGLKHEQFSSNSSRVHISVFFGAVQDKMNGNLKIILYLNYITVGLLRSLVKGLEDG